VGVGAGVDAAVAGCSEPCGVGFDGTKNRDAYRTAKESKKAKRILFSIGNFSSKDRNPLGAGGGSEVTAQESAQYHPGCHTARTLQLRTPNMLV